MLQGVREAKSLGLFLPGARHENIVGLLGVVKDAALNDTSGSLANAKLMVLELAECSLDQHINRLVGPSGR